MVSELVWYLVTKVCEVKKLTRSINYIHEAYRNYLRSYHTGNCVNIINISSALRHFHELAHANPLQRYVNTSLAFQCIVSYMCVLCLCVCVYFMFVCVSANTYISMHTGYWCVCDVYVCMYVCVCLNVVCIYECLCVYVYMYVHNNYISCIFASAHAYMLITMTYNTLLTDTAINLISTAGHVDW